MDDAAHRLDLDRRASRITPEERQLIDEAVAGGRVTYIPTGASTFDRNYVWRRQINEDGRLAAVRARASPETGAASGTAGLRGRSFPDKTHTAPRRSAGRRGFAGE